jgi:hypothetical protein
MCVNRDLNITGTGIASLHSVLISELSVRFADVAEKRQSRWPYD